MDMQTGIHFFFRYLLIPSIVPLLFLVFWPRNLIEKDLIRIGKLFAIKTILICALVYITQMVAFKPLFQGTLLLYSFVVSFIAYLALTAGLIYFCRDILQKNKIGWAFLVADLLCWVPYFIWEIVLGYILFEDFGNYLGLPVIFWRPKYYFYVLIPTLITTITFGILSLYLVRQRQSENSTKLD